MALLYCTQDTTALHCSSEFNYNCKSLRTALCAETNLKKHLPVSRVRAHKAERDRVPYLTTCCSLYLIICLVQLPILLYSIILIYVESCYCPLEYRMFTAPPIFCRNFLFRRKLLCQISKEYSASLKGNYIYN